MPALRRAAVGEGADRVGDREAAALHGRWRDPDGIGRPSKTASRALTAGFFLKPATVRLSGRGRARSSLSAISSRA